MSDHMDRFMIAGFPWPNRQPQYNAIPRAEECVRRGLLEAVPECGEQAFRLTAAGHAALATIGSARP